MKRYLAISLIVLLAITAFAGCQPKSEAASEEQSTKVNVVTTNFPPYDFTRQIAGDKADITMLVDPGAESHSFEPTPQDIITIQNCDIFIYSGGESEDWVNSILESVNTENIMIIKLLDCVSAYAEEIKEGMEDEHEHEGEEHEGEVLEGEEEHEHVDGEAHEHEDGEIVYDEHVWTSPQNAILIANVIRDGLCYADNANAEFYQTDAEAYTKQLSALDQEFRTLTENAKHKTLVFGDRFPFLYFTEAYDLDYWAAFPGCSTETEPSAATVAFLIDKVKADKIPVILKIELSNGNIAQTISEATGAKVMTLNSCHNLSRDDFEAGVTYLSLMEENIKVLKEALK